MEVFKAPKNKVYVHKTKGIELHGEHIYIRAKDDYKIEDFELKTKEEVDALRKAYLSGDEK